MTLEVANKEIRSEAKMELMTISSNMMVDGKPNIVGVIKYPMIKKLIEDHGKKKILKAVFLLVKDFCNSINVVRNMNEDQMIECANMLIDECGDFRMEDYVMMFQIAKRGILFDFRDRLDMQIVTKILDAYWIRRLREGREEQEREYNYQSTLESTDKMKNTMNPDDTRIDKILLKIEDKCMQTKNEIK